MLFHPLQYLDRLLSNGGGGAGGGLGVMLISAFCACLRGSSPCQLLGLPRPAPALWKGNREKFAAAARVADLHKVGARGEGSWPHRSRRPRQAAAGPGAESTDLGSPRPWSAANQRVSEKQRRGRGLSARAGEPRGPDPTPQNGEGAEEEALGPAGPGPGRSPASWLPAVPGSGRGLQEVTQTRRVGGGPR